MSIEEIHDSRMSRTVTHGYYFMKKKMGLV